MKDALVAVKVPSATKRQWIRAATRHHLPLAEWLRRVVDAAAAPAPPTAP